MPRRAYPPPQHADGGRSVSAQPRRIVFQHPAYPLFAQPLFTFAACDENDTIDHEIARAACAVAASNRYDGYLTTDVTGRERVTLPQLPFIENGYFFHVPGYDSMSKLLYMRTRR